MENEEKRAAVQDGQTEEVTELSEETPTDSVELTEAAEPEKTAGEVPAEAAEPEETAGEVPAEAAEPEVPAEEAVPEKQAEAASVRKTARKSRKKTSSRKKGKGLWIALLVVLLVLLALVGGIIGLFYHYYSLMAAPEDVSYSDEVTLTDQDLKEIPDGTVEVPENNIYSDKQVVNILLIGTDERTAKFDKYARADSIMVLSLNKKTHAVKLVSLERGMLVKIPGRKDDILTHTFHYGGANLVIQTVRTHFNLDVDRYIRVNFSVFEKVVDRVGGVDITLNAAEVRALNQSAKMVPKVHEGKNHVNGQQALCYARLRSIDSDWQRIKRQRKVIASIRSNLNKMSVGEMNDMANECLPYVQTNLTSLEFAELLLNLPAYTGGDFDQMTIPEKGTYKGLGQVDFKANSRILREFLYEE